MPLRSFTNRRRPGPLPSSPPNPSLPPSPPGLPLRPHLPHPHLSSSLPQSGTHAARLAGGISPTSHPGRPPPCREPSAPRRQPGTAPSFLPAVARPADVRRGGTWNYGSCPIRPSLWVGIPESPTESRSETGRRESPLEFCGGLQPARGGRGLGEGSVSPPVVRSFCGDSYFHVYSTSACAESFAEEWCIKKPTKHQERFCQILKREASKRPLAVNLRLFTVTMHCNVVQTSDSEITRVLINGSIRGDWSGGKKPSHVTQKVSFSTRDFRSLN